MVSRYVPLTRYVSARHKRQRLIYTSWLRRAIDGLASTSDKAQCDKEDDPGQSRATGPMAGGESYASREYIVRSRDVTSDMMGPYNNMPSSNTGGWPQVADDFSHAVHIHLTGHASLSRSPT